ncbi:hypothetical protein [Paraburkholderia youngii]|uniref:hypothetical protein n=1 Tax=Paraburkholderia youngii TaxID=2782701 RepID=UPI003D1F139B
MASSLQAYLQIRVILHCEKLTDEERKRVFRKGWFRGYNIIFTEAFRIPSKTARWAWMFSKTSF